MNDWLQGHGESADSRGSLQCICPTYPVSSTYRLMLSILFFLYLLSGFQSSAVAATSMQDSTLPSPSWMKLGKSSLQVQDCLEIAGWTLPLSSKEQQKAKCSLQRRGCMLTAAMVDCQSSWDCRLHFNILFLGWKEAKSSLQAHSTLGHWKLGVVRGKFSSGPSTTMIPSTRRVCGSRAQAWLSITHCTGLGLALVGPRCCYCSLASTAQVGAPLGHRGDVV